MKTLFIVSGGLEAVPGIRRAKEMGLHVVVSDQSPRAPGLSWADDVILASTYDVEATVQAARQYHRTKRPLDGVICIAADVPLTVAAVAADLGLPGISLEAARLSMDKMAMKQRFAAVGVPIPWFCAVESAGHLQELVKKRGYPLVLKPVDSRGARGVLQLTPGLDLAWAYQYSRQFSPTSRVMLEEFLAGQQISTESMLVNGGGATPGFTDRNYEYLERFAPYIIENGGQQPSVVTREERERLARLAEDAGRALGITTGVVKGDLVLTAAGPKVIEIAARLSGGWFCTDQIPLGAGVDLVAAAIRSALGEQVAPEDLMPRHRRGVAIRYFFPNPGRITAIRQADRCTQLPWVHRLNFFLGVGDLVAPVTEHPKRVGFVITTGETREQAVERAVDVIETVRVETDSG